MRYLFAVLGIVSIVVGFITTSTIRSDIQVQIVLTCLIGGFILIGIAVIISRIESFIARITVK
ncbi:hypothetical protein [Chelatococcus asaccharovorans]|uniref:Uncharacterized protein n=1 Tax=Chelatococcus asaccharovorans TaxID=28210 RepID=A0A2V3U385_9HYPH|nr:hypothetical protein [Chelatococcus asaccharovorans]MBS7702704.1 hypothetical protein [Chelatococcus asaccharovorans]PXW56997.1 hypothetical protein C7450_10734 [Chelatococcus asaccharovorans]